MLESIKDIVKKTITARGELEYLRMKIKLNSLSLDLIKSGGIPVNYETVVHKLER